MKCFGALRTYAEKPFYRRILSRLEHTRTHSILFSASEIAGASPGGRFFL